MFAIKSTFEEDILQYKSKAKTPKKVLDTFATIF